MRTKLKKLFDSRLFNMALALLIAVVAWLIVITTISPQGEQTVRGVPVNFKYNSEGYTNQELDIVSQPSYTVNIRLKGDRSVVNSIDKENLVVYPSYSSVNGAGTYELPLLVKLQGGAGEYDGVTVVNGKDLAPVEVTFDTVVTKSFAVVTDTSSLQIAEGYIFDKAEPNPRQVTLEGPESEISKVSKVVAPLYLEGARSESVIATSTLEAVGETGEKLKLKYVTFSPETADITISVLQQKELPLTIDFINVPDGFDVSTLKYRLSVEKMVVAGEAGKLETLSELNVGYFDLSTFALGRDYNMDIKLPTGIKSQENLSSVVLSFDNTGLVEKKVDVTDIRQANVPDNYKLKINTKRIRNVTLIGPAEELEALKASAVVAQVNAEDFQVSNGTQNVPVRILVPGSSGIFAVGSYTAECVLTTDLQE